MQPFLIMYEWKQNHFLAWGLKQYANVCKDMLVLLACRQQHVLSEGGRWTFFKAAAGLDALCHFASKNNQSMSQTFRKSAYLPRCVCVCV